MIVSTDHLRHRVWVMSRHPIAGSIKPIRQSCSCIDDAIAATEIKLEPLSA